MLQVTSSPLLFLHSDHDDEVASLASTSGGFGAKASTQRLPVKDWKAKASPRASPKLKRKGKKDDGYAGLARIRGAVGPAVQDLTELIAAGLGSEAGLQPSVPNPHPVLQTGATPQKVLLATQTWAVCYFKVWEEVVPCLPNWDPKSNV